MVSYNNEVIIITMKNSKKTWYSLSNCNTSDTFLRTLFSFAFSHIVLKSQSQKSCKRPKAKNPLKTESLVHGRRAVQKQARLTWGRPAYDTSCLPTLSYVHSGASSQLPPVLPLVLTPTYRSSIWVSPALPWPFQITLHLIFALLSPIWWQPLAADVVHLVY